MSRNAVSDIGASSQIARLLILANMNIKRAYGCHLIQSHICFPCRLSDPSRLVIFASFNSVMSKRNNVEGTMVSHMETLHASRTNHVILLIEEHVELVSCFCEVYRRHGLLVFDSVLLERLGGVRLLGSHLYFHSFLLSMTSRWIMSKIFLCTSRSQIRGYY
jgi:hypothetical protein